MITREVLLAKRKEYEEAKKKAIGTVNALAGAIEAIDDLLALVAQQVEPSTAEGDNHA
ncbi:MAG: hypothetical protein WC565_10165 [Parcubacteria group bacterium]